MRDLNTLGFLFEALCERDLKIYAEAFGASLYHYQDYHNQEMDAVIVLPDGEWCGIEITLGPNQVESVENKTENPGGKKRKSSQKPLCDLRSFQCRLSKRGWCFRCAVNCTGSLIHVISFSPFLFLPCYKGMPLAFYTFFEDFQAFLRFQCPSYILCFITNDAGRNKDAVLF